MTRAPLFKIKKSVLAVTWIALAIVAGCGGPIFHQPGAELDHIYARVFLTDYNTAWQATLEALKRFEKTTQNRQGGVLQTSWIDNTAEKNFIDSFGGDATYIKARYRLNVSIAPGNYNGKPSVKVSILKDQMIQRDLLEGWKQVKSDAIEENTYLYRIGRIIYIKLKLKEIEERKVREVIEQGV
ncbi:MAG: hypothetical protein AB1540_01515 [Bdellovibrionota bacterium]